MAFLHKETTWVIQVLTQVWEKSSYVAWDSVTWHLKAFSLEDTTFDATWIDWASYKFTIKWDVTIVAADQIIIDWDIYIVEVVKKYKWISFNTTKILLSTK